MSTMVEDYEFTPERVKGIRIRLGETQREFAKRVKVTVGTVSGWEMGENSPKRGPVVRRLLDAEREAQEAA